MAEAPGRVYIPRRARPVFGRGAFEGSVVPASTPTEDMRTADPSPIGAPQPFPVVPVNPTAFSAGNRWRHFLQPIMFEWWAWRPRNNQAIFVANPAQFHRTVHRRMARVRMLDGLVANRRVIYDAPSYGPQGDLTGVQRGLPAFDYRRRR